MTQPAKVQEPSMEEILASIRRIIADDEAKPAPESRAAPPPAEQPAEAAPGPHARPPVKPAVAPKAVAAQTGPSPAGKSGNHPLQDDVDSLLAGLDDETSADDVRAGPDVLELTEQMAVGESRSFQTVEASSDIEFAEADELEPEPPPPAPEPVVPARAAVVEPQPAPPPRPLLSQTTVAAVDSAFNSLAQTVLSNNARTLEDLVKEMLRPMLKGWLDDNLPGLVEKIVRAEIERVSRGR